MRKFLQLVQWYDCTLKLDALKMNHKSAAVRGKSNGIYHLHAKSPHDIYIPSASAYLSNVFWIPVPLKFPLLTFSLYI